jgi:hypothetical protein
MPEKYFPQWPKTPFNSEPNDPHGRALWHLQAAHRGLQLLRQDFSERKAQIEERGRIGELGPLGVSRELKKLAVEFDDDLKRLASLIDIGKKYHSDLKTKLTSRETPKSASADEAVERAFARHRTIQRFEALDSSQRREAVKVAIQKGDAAFLSVLLAEPALLDQRTAVIIEKRADAQCR